MKTLQTSLLIFSWSAAAAMAEPPAQAELATENAMVRELSDLKAEQFDVEFLKMMIAHHESGIAMMKLHAENGANDQLKSLAADLSDKHSGEVRKMSDWLKQWHNAAPDDSAVPEPADHKAKEELMRLKSLKGEDLDKAFVELMIRHHQDGIAMFRLVEDRSEREELEKFAKDGIKQQQKEIEQLSQFGSE